MTEQREPLKSLTRAVRSFRLGQTGAGSEAFALFLGHFEQLLGSAAIEVDMHALQAFLGTLLAAQARGDDLWVADLLEYELAPLFRGDP